MNETPTLENDAPVEQDFASFLRSQWWFYFAMLAMCSTIVLLAVAMRNPGPEKVYLPGIQMAVPELCMTKRLYDFGCPGCGMTRGCIAMAHGQWSRAWQFNPAAVLLFPAMVVAIPYCAWQLWRISKERLPVSLPYFPWLFAVLTAILVGQWIVKLLM